MADSSKKMQHTLGLVFQHAVSEPIVAFRPRKRRIIYHTYNLVLAVYLCQLLRNFLRSIWAVVIDYNDLPFKLTRQVRINFPRRQATYFSVNVLANNQIMTGKFLRSLYVGRMTLYLWVSEEWNNPCILRDTLLSNGFIQGSLASLLNPSDVSEIKCRHTTWLSRLHHHHCPRLSHPYPSLQNSMNMAKPRQ